MPPYDALGPVGWGRALKGKLGRVYGHDVVADKSDVLRYADDLSVMDEHNMRPCIKCGLHPRDFGGHDPCIANLPGVRNACCGHGKDRPYIEFEDGRVIIGEFSIHRRSA